MGCQKSIAANIIDEKADYVLALKGNQSIFHNEVKDFFETAYLSDFEKVAHDFYESHDKGHARLEHRRCWTLSANESHFPSIKKWLNLKSIIMVKSHREYQNKVTEDTRFYISSTEADAKKALHAVQEHWGVENSLHWTLDVTFRKDESRIRKEASPENFAIIRHIALNIIKSDSSLKASVKRKRMLAALKDDYRETLIRQFI